MIIFIRLLMTLLTIVAFGIIIYFIYLFYCWKKQQNINTNILQNLYFYNNIAIPIEDWKQIKAIIASEYALNKERFKLEDRHGISGEILVFKGNFDTAYYLYFVHFFDYLKMLSWYAKLRRQKQTVSQKREYAAKQKAKKEFYQLVATIGQENVDELNNIINNNLNNINNTLIEIKTSLK